MSTENREKLARFLKLSARVVAFVPVILFLLIVLFLASLAWFQGGVTIYAESYLIILLELAGLGGVIMTWKNEIIAMVLLSASSIILAIVFAMVVVDVINLSGFVPWFYLGMPFLIGAVLLLLSRLLSPGSSD